MEKNKAGLILEVGNLHKFEITEAAASADVFDEKVLSSGFLNITGKKTLTRGQEAALLSLGELLHRHGGELIVTMESDVMSFKYKRAPQTRKSVIENGEQLETTLVLPDVYVEIKPEMTGLVGKQE